MKIIIKREVVIKIKNKIVNEMPNESKGACFAYHRDKELFEIIDTFVSDCRGTKFFSNLIINKKYRKFEKNFFKSNNYDYKHYNYIGDWHSHPLFECYPSTFDKEEVVNELKHSNANFLIQLILKIENGMLVGNCFLYNGNEIGKKIEMIIEE